MTSDTSEQIDQKWQLCPAGEVAGLVKSLQRSRRRRRLQRISAAVCGVAVAGLIGLYAVPHPMLVEPLIGGISCTEVENLADEYVAGLLDGDTRARIDAHLKSCEECHALMTDLRDRRAAFLMPASRTQPQDLSGDATLALQTHAPW